MDDDPARERIEPARPARARHSVKVARGVSGGTGFVVRSFYLLFLVVGALLVVGAWGALPVPEIVLAWGLAIAALGTWLWTTTLPMAAAPRERRPLAMRSEILARSPRRILAGLVAIAFIAGGTIVCITVEVTSRGDGEPFFVLGVGAGSGLFAVMRARHVSAWLGPQPDAKVRADRPNEPWVWDFPWSEAGEKRYFIRYLNTRSMFAGRMAALFGALVVPVPAGLYGGWIVAVKLALAAAAALWAWRAWRVLFMGNVFLGYVRVPVHPGERAVFTFGVSEGGTEISEVSFVLRHFGESLDANGPGGGLPLATMRIHETGNGPRSFVAGCDQEVVFDIPADAPGTSMSALWPSYWEVEVRGRTREGAYEERFLVPVYARRLLEPPPLPGA